MWTMITLMFGKLPEWAKRLFWTGLILILVSVYVWLAFKEFNKVLTNRYNEGVAAGIAQHKALVAENNLTAVELIRKDMTNLSDQFKNGMLKLDANQQVANDTTAKVLKGLKTQQATLITKDGKCVPSEEFIASWNALIQANALR